MALTKSEKSKVISSVTAYLSSVKSASRKDVINDVLKRFGFSEKSKGKPDSKCNLIRSYAGSAFNDMVADKTIVKCGEGYALNAEKLVVVDKNKCKTAILNILKKKPYTKKNLYSELQKHFKTKETGTEKDDNNLKQIAGQILNDLVNANKVTVVKGEYSAVKEQAKSKIKPLTEEIVKKLFLERLRVLGGNGFEKFAANLLEKYYVLTGREVLHCEVVGGTEDGGIDVSMVVTDELGFSDNLLIQAKCRKSAQVTEKEVREFFGALNLKGGSRGIYITTSTFHAKAKELIKSLNNCVGIDGDGVFELAKTAAYGIKSNKEGYLLDESVFDD